MSKSKIASTSSLPPIPGLPFLHQGKVRETYGIDEYPDILLVVASDRVSTHNICHKSTIPLKGRALTAMTVFWMRDVFPDVPNHLIAYGRDIYDFLPKSDLYPKDSCFRSIVVQKLDMIPVEFIFRNRMAGSLWKDFYSKGLPNPYGLILPGGLQLMSEFPEAIFTPTDKSETDDPIDSLETIARYPEACELTRTVYERAREIAARSGIDIIDGKFEVGVNQLGGFVLGDECLTSDACRLVEMSDIQVGKEPSWLDKQLVREVAERMWAGVPAKARWPLEFDPETINEATSRYLKVIQRLIGVSLEDYQLNW